MCTLSLSIEESEIIAHHENHKNMSRTPIRDHSSKDDGMNPLRLAALVASPFCFAKRGGSAGLNHSSKNITPIPLQKSELSEVFARISLTCRARWHIFGII